MSEFDAKHVVITGGTGALGSAIVGELLRRGAVCHIPVYQPRELERFPHTASDQVRLVEGVDLRDEDQVTKFFGGVGSLWASIHTSGAFTMGPIAETSLDDYHKMMSINMQTCFLSCREAIRRIRETGQGGRLVNVSAKPALVPTAGVAAYAASKAAVAALTQCVAEEVRDARIWVNAVVPSTMDTPANRAAMPKADHTKWPSVADVAETIVFLASPENKATRGALVPVYGRS